MVITAAAVARLYAAGWWFLGYLDGRNGTNKPDTPVSMSSMVFRRFRNQVVPAPPVGRPGSILLFMRAAGTRPVAAAFHRSAQGILPGSYAGERLGRSQHLVINVMVGVYIVWRLFRRILRPSHAFRRFHTPSKPVRPHMGGTPVGVPR